MTSKDKEEEKKLQEVMTHWQNLLVNKEPDKEPWTKVQKTNGKNPTSPSVQIAEGPSNALEQVFTTTSLPNWGPRPFTPRLVTPQELIAKYGNQPTAAKQVRHWYNDALKGQNEQLYNAINNLWHSIQKKDNSMAYHLSALEKSVAQQQKILQKENEDLKLKLSKQEEGYTKAKAIADKMTKFCSTSASQALLRLKSTMAIGMSTEERQLKYMITDIEVSDLAE